MMMFDADNPYFKSVILRAIEVARVRAIVQSAEVVRKLGLGNASFLILKLLDEEELPTRKMVKGDLWHAGPQKMKPGDLWQEAS